MSVVRALSVAQQDARGEKRACAHVVDFVNVHSAYLLRVLDCVVDPLPVGKQRHACVVDCPLILYNSSYACP